MKLLFRLGKEAIRYKGLYVVAILSTLALTIINLAAPWFLSDATQIISDGITESGLQKIGGLTILLTALFLLRVVFRFFSNFLAHKAAWNLVRDLRVKVYDKIQSLSMSYFHDKQTGDLMSRVVNDTATFEMLFAHVIPEMITNFITVAGAIAILMAINAKLALLTCIPLPFIFISGILFSKKVQPHFREAQASLGGVNSKIQDNFSGIHEIQSFGKEERETTAVKAHASRYTENLLRALKLAGIFHPSVEFLSDAGKVIVIGFGGFFAYYNGLSVSDVVAFLLYLSLFYAPISGLAKLLEDAQQSYAGAERVMVVLDQEKEIQDEPGAISLGNAEGRIEFRGVDFQYQDEAPVLKNVSFSCAPGQTVALVGPTGVGKTTLVQLISRFYNPTSGSILIDGRNIKSITLESLRKNIAPVLQDTYLFNATIAENIAYSVPEADFEMVVEAAKAACIHESIMEMPDGYDTKVGERGLRLSGGQKQRIAIARAILREAPIIILDEATASVDTETEKEIQRAINNLSKKKTIIAIAHRLSTIQGADLILVLKDGYVVQSGTHNELMAQDGLYRRLNMTQAYVGDETIDSLYKARVPGYSFVGGIANSM
ncbi:MAG: ABC transporter ATP-binding protein/permease [Oscillospiraceae bacterium]|nr:ABC transporter ATP-binding protein/permease [Oscillospiraceae bacterium]